MFYDVREVEKNLYLISSKEGTSCYLVVGEWQAVLIDTGYGFGDLKSCVKNITRKPLIIVNTHGHMDHVGGNFQFEEIAFIHKKDWELAEKGCSNASRVHSVERARNYMNYVTGIQENILPEGFNLDSYIQERLSNIQEIIGN